MDELAQRISWEWLQKLFTFYADDALASWLVRGPEHLQQALENIQTVIEVFNRLGMKINVKESAILYDLKGLDVKKILKKKLVKAQGSFFLKAQQQGEQVLIPIVRQHDYLGTIISFRDPANLTLNKRLLKARGQYSMLRKIINSIRIVSKKCRYRIWEAGVLSSSTYGLLATGLTTTGCTRLRQMASRQTRAIARLPARLTHVPNVQVRALLGAPDVVQQLHDAGGRHLAKLVKISETTPQDIRCHDIAVTHLRHVLTTFKLETDAAPSQPHQPDRETYGIKCDVCGLGFATFNNMRKRKTRVRGINDRQTIEFDPAAHAIQGLPQCRFCEHKFDTWSALKTHITEDRCTQTPWMKARLQAMSGAAVSAPTAALLQEESGPSELPEAVSPPQTYPILANPEVKSLLLQRGWKSLITSEHQEHLRQHCVVCARWIVDPTALKRHVKQAHKDLWSQVEKQLDNLCAELKGDLIRDGVCQFCDRTSYSRHFKQCNVIFQSAIAGLILLPKDDGGGNADGDVSTSHAGVGVSGRSDPRADETAGAGQRPAQAAANKKRCKGRTGQRGQSSADGISSCGNGTTTRRCTQPHPAQHQSDILPSAARARLCPVSPIQSEPGMAKEQDCRTGSRVSPRHNTERLDPGDSPC